MKKALPWILLAAVVAFIAYKLHTSHFDWVGFGHAWRTADWRLVLAAIACIYSINFFRAVRWSVFLKPAYQQLGTPARPWYSLIGSQFVGFTGLAIFGRIGELIRPLLVARRTNFTFASQVAVVTVERVFDLGAFALIFSLNLLFSSSLQTLPHHELFHKVGYAIAALTTILIVFVAAVRLSGTLVANLMGRFVGMISKPAGTSIAEKVLAFRDGLNVIASAGDFAVVTLMSLIIWAIIAISYVCSLRAFPPPVHDLTVAHALLLMGFSVVGSLVQFPGVGGGAQVATISALTVLFGVPQELAVSAGLMLWLIQNMSIIPAGLIFARVEGISLKQLANTSEAKEEQILST